MRSTRPWRRRCAGRRAPATPSPILRRARGNIMGPPSIRCCGNSSSPGNTCSRRCVGGARTYWDSCARQLRANCPASPPGPTGRTPRSARNAKSAEHSRHRSRVGCFGWFVGCDWGSVVPQTKHKPEIEETCVIPRTQRQTRKN